MAPRETENNAYAKFWGDKQRALWYVMVFLEWSIQSQEEPYVSKEVKENALANLADQNKQQPYRPLSMKQTFDRHMSTLKVKNDHRSKFSNLSNWKEEA